jgi:hypothetical protein
MGAWSTAGKPPLFLGNSPVPATVVYRGAARDGRGQRDGWVAEDDHALAVARAELCRHRDPLGVLAVLECAVGRVALGVELPDVRVRLPQGVPDWVRLEEAVVEGLADAGGEGLAGVLVLDRPVEGRLDMADEGSERLGRAQQRLWERGDVGAEANGLSRPPATPKSRRRRTPCMGAGGQKRPTVAWIRTPWSGR